MKIRLRPLVDHELDEFRLGASSIEPDTHHRVFQVFETLREKRTRVGICSCTDKDYTRIVSGRGTNEVAVVFGWFCELCIAHLENMLTDEVPEIESGSVGSKRGPYPPCEQRAISFRNMKAEFEDGRSLDLAPFAIQKSCVTIGQFAEFARATEYVTSAEKRARAGDYTYYAGPTIDPIKPRDRPNMPACSLSCLDPTAYCEWAQVRLPSEAELLAASLIDARIMDRNEMHAFLFGSAGRFDRSRFPNALDDLGPQWVVGDAPPGYAIARSGPFLVREYGWETRKHRTLCPVDAFDLTCSFRTCTDID